MDIAASGMRSAMLQIGASAHNVANLNTPEPRQLRAIQTDLPGGDGSGGGASAHLQREQAGREIDLAYQVIRLIQSATQFNASRQAFSVASETRGTLVDMLV